MKPNPDGESGIHFGADWLHFVLARWMIRPDQRWVGAPRGDSNRNWTISMAATVADQTLEPRLRTQGVAPYLVVEYLYRDAGNYKAYGDLWLTGLLSQEGRSALIGSLESGEFFIAEQVGVPPLYEKLFSESGGRTDDDHAWHTFLGFREEYQLPSDVTVWGKAIDLMAAIVTAEGEWKPHLSPNYGF